MPVWGPQTTPPCLAPCHPSLSPCTPEGGRSFFSGSKQTLLPSKTSSALVLSVGLMARVDDEENPPFAVSQVTPGSFALHCFRGSRNT